MVSTVLGVADTMANKIKFLLSLSLHCIWERETKQIVKKLHIMAGSDECCEEK